MLQLAEARKKCPVAVEGSEPGGVELQPNRSPAHRVMQPRPHQPRAVPSIPENLPTGFRCAWCRIFHKWCDIAAFFGRLKFCRHCTAEIAPGAPDRTK